MDLARFVDTSTADAMAAKVGPDLSPADSPPGRTLADMEPETLALVLAAVAGTARQLQHVAWTQRMTNDMQRELVQTIGRLMTAENQLRRHLAGLAPAA